MYIKLIEMVYALPCDPEFRFTFDKKVFVTGLGTISLKLKFLQNLACFLSPSTVQQRLLCSNSINPHYYASEYWKFPS